MKNLFQYGGIVEGAAFCNRTKELADLTAAVGSSEKLFLYSERRLGKTSLVRTVPRKLPKDRYASAYIDLWPTDAVARMPQRPFPEQSRLAHLLEESRRPECWNLEHGAKHLLDCGQHDSGYLQVNGRSPCEAVTEPLIEAAIKVLLDRES